MSALSRRQLGLAVLLLGSAAVAGLAYLADRRDRTVSISVRCDDRACEASTDGGEPLRIDVPAMPGRQIGLYTYHPHEFDQPQSFRSIRAKTADLAGEIRVRLEPEAWAPERWHGDAGWHMTASGLRHHGRLGQRAVTLLGGFESRRFQVDAELVDAIDSGVVFGASDVGAGWVFVVRPRQNDAYVFRLDAGEPGPIVALMPLRSLGAGREGLRLAGLLGRILLVTVPLLLVTRRWLAGSTASARGRDDQPALEHAPLRWLLALSALTVAALSAVALGGLGGVPHVDDEAAYLFQAKIFAAGRAWAPAPPAPEFFRHEHMITTAERWFAKYPPLFPALLSLGVRSGAAWLVNPALGALVGLAAYLLGRELADWRWGVASWLLLLVSPFFLIMGGTMMSHVAAALFVTLFLWLLLRSLERHSGWSAAWAGVCLGLAVLTRPYTALLAASAAAIYGLAHVARSNERRAVVAFGVLAVVTTLPFVGAFVAWGPWVSGAAGAHVGLHEAYNASDTLGFGPDKGATWLRTWGSYGHTPAKGLRSAWQHLEYTSRHLLGWPGYLSFVLILAPFVLGAAGAREWLLIGVFLALVLGHMGYWAAHHIVYGARYWFEAVPALMVLGALGLRALVSDRGMGGWATAWAPGVAAAGLAALVAWNAWAYLPDRLRELPLYAGTSAGLARQIERLAPERTVVFYESQGDSDPGFFLNDPFLGSDQVFAHDLGARNAELLGHLPGYLTYRWSAEHLEPLGRAVSR